MHEILTNPCFTATIAGQMTFTSASLMIVSKSRALAVCPKDPLITEKDDSVLVMIKHGPPASPEEAIMDYLTTHATINNSQARQIDYSVKNIFGRMIAKGMIEQVPGTQRRTSAYRKVIKLPATQI